MKKVQPTKTTKPVTASMDEITQDFTKEDWDEVEKEKKLYSIVTNLQESM